MITAVERLLRSRGRCLLIVAVVTGAAGLLAAPALAAPEWGITMTHVNPYGAQAASCPGGHESLPGEPDCGVDPYTGSGTTFDRDSGFNAYTITATNTASTTGQGLTAGVTLSCQPGEWEEQPTFTYRWLRDGVVIAGAEAKEYTLVSEDEGKAIQCQVTAANSSGAASYATAAVVVEPPPAITPPASTSLPVVPEESTTVPVGSALTCSSGRWSGTPTFSYRWLRDGTLIAGAESSRYTTTSEDLESSIQCQVIATNAGGSVVADNHYFTFMGTAEPAPYPPYNTREPTIPPVHNSSETAGPVSVADQLPQGFVLAGGSAAEHVSGAGWTCTFPDTTRFTCVRSDALAPGASYAPIVLHVYVEAAAANQSVNVATVSGGGAVSNASVSDPTTIAAAVPFGIQSFTTSVTESLGNPLTQAGGHPFAANASFAFNYTTNTDDRLTDAGGSPMEVETELPPGFVGNPQNTPQCPGATFANSPTSCPANTAVGFVAINLDAGVAKIENGHPTLGNQPVTSEVFNLTPPPGVPAAFGFNVLGGVPFVLYGHVRSDGDYGITVGDYAAGRPSPMGFRLTFCDDGASSATACSSTPLPGWNAPFLTNPTQCTGQAPVTTLRADSYQDQTESAFTTSYTGAPSAPPSFAGEATSHADPVASSFLTGCNLLQFSPTIEFKPETTQAEQPTGMEADLKVPQTNEASVDATPELKDATVTLPEGMSVSPSAVDGLQACTDGQFGLGSTVEPAEVATCPLASQIGTVKIVSPLLPAPLAGQVFIGQPECSPCTAQDAEEGHIFRLFLQAQGSGVIVKVTGKVSANPATGRLTATFTNQPQLPFSELVLSFKGGPRSPLANPQTCGTTTVGSDFTPWSAPGVGGFSGEERILGTPDAVAEGPSFEVDWDGHGGVCPGSLPFSPSFVAGTVSSAAGAYSNLAVTLARPEPARESEERDEQNLAGITVVTPPGLLGKISGVLLCEEPQASAGTCSQSSQIGTVTAAAGTGSHPFYIEGRVYLTGPYKGEPFGLSIVVPAVAGPFDLGTVVVRASIAVNPNDAHLTITSDPFPQIVDGVPLRLHKIHVEVNRPEFIFNPTSCSAQSIQATITGEHVNTGEANASEAVSAPFAAGGCKNLKFAPKFAVSTSGRTSKSGGASLTADLSYPGGSQGSQANITKVKVELPKQLPSRLTTLQKACTAAQFAANPAGCPSESKIGSATVDTPLLPVPLSGPAIFVSHGGEAFPSLTLVLQGDGVTIDLAGTTFISKAGVTSTTFKTVPDAPFSTFTLTLPEGKYSALAANGDLCTSKLVMPTEFVAQNGNEMHQNTLVTVGGCSTSLSFMHSIKKKTLTLSVYAPAAGKITARGKGLTSRTKIAKGREEVTFALKQKKAGNLKTTVKVAFKPARGKAQSKSAKLTFKK